MNDVKVVSFVNDRMNLQDAVVGTKIGNTNINVSTPLSDQGSVVVPAGTRLTWTVSGIGGNNMLESDVHVLATVSVVYTRGTDFVTNYATILAAAQNKTGLHSCPLNRLIQTCEVTFNGQERFSSSPSEHVDFLIHQYNESELRKISDISRPDNSFSYNSAVLSDVLRTQADSFFSSRGLGCTRITSITEDVGATAFTVVYELREALLASPFQHTSSPKSFIGIDNLTVACTLAGDVSLATAAAGSSTTGVIAAVSTISNVRLELRNSTPHIGYQMKKQASWLSPDFVFKDSSVTVLPAAAAGGVNTVTISSEVTRHFSTVPKVLCVYAYESRVDVNAPLRFFPISNLALRVAGASNVFGSYTKDQLYGISKRYGLNSLPSCLNGFYGGTAVTSSGIGNGFMFYFSFADIDAPELFQSNALRSFDITIDSVTVQNYDTAANNIRVRLMALSDKLVEYKDGQWKSNTVGLTDEQLVLANAEHQFIDIDYSNDTMLGGSIWSWIRDKVIKPVVRYGREHSTLSNLASQVNPTLGKVVKAGEEAISPYLQKQGYGMLETGGNVIETGGKKMTQAQLIKALRVK